jgi:trans-2,3-dihydro-3-hydroxyanthranilate isomerase
MKKPTFYFVDVFAEEKYAGNQLAVVVDTDSLSDEQMQKIAHEIHFSETTFILPKKQNTKEFNVRIFTPTEELPFAGHPTLGTAYVIKRSITKNKTKQITLNLKAGKIPVTFEEKDGKEILWMKQLKPVFGKTFQIDQFQSLLNLKESDFDIKHVIQEISTGLPFIIVPLKNLDAVKRARINPAIIHEFTKRTPAGILIFSRETYDKDNQLNVRVFVDAFGIPEDPATGSGNGCLAAYLSKNEYFGTPEVKIKVEQGFEIRRPSKLYLKVKNEGKELSIYVGGQVVFVAKGKLF